MDLFEAVCCMLYMLCGRWSVGMCFASSLEAGVGFVTRFVGGAMQPTFPEGRLVGVAVVGPVRRPPERGYSSISGIERIKILIVLC